MRTTELCRLLNVPIKFFVGSVFLVILTVFNIRVIAVVKNKWLAISLMEPCLLLCAIAVSLGLAVTVVMMWQILKGICGERTSSLNLGMSMIKPGLFISGMAIGIATFLVFFSTPTTEIILRKTFASYESDPSMAHQMDVIQKGFRCCGIEGYEDWYLGRRTYSRKDCYCKQPRKYGYCKLPRSCAFSNKSYERLIYKFGCSLLSENVTVLDIGCKMESEKPMIYQNGCLWATSEFMGGFSRFLLAVSIMMFLLQVATLCDARRVLKNRLTLNEENITNMKEPYII